MKSGPEKPRNPTFAADSCDSGLAKPADHPPDNQAKGERTVVLFDGVCDLCDTGMVWLRHHDRTGRLEFLPFQAPEVAARYPGLDPARLAAAIHVVTPDGAVHVGADAAGPIFAVLPGWGLAARLLGLPGIRALARPLYGWIAARRHIFLTSHRGRG